jgi:site-specific recombinase XerD
MVLTRCDLPSSRILIEGKYRRERYAFLSPQAHRAISIWIDHRTRYAAGHDYLYCNIPSGAPLSDRVLRLVVAGRGAAALGPWLQVHPHMLRHTMATHLTDNGIDMPDLARLLGHASLSSTLVYQHVAPNRLAQIHARYLAADTEGVAL